jgi:phage terminase small subunit
MAKESAKAAKFVQEYLVDLNATQAAIRAGYAPVGAAVTGSRLLRNPKIRAQLDSAIAERSKRTEITADAVLQELWRVGKSDIAKAFSADGKLLPVHEMPPEARAAIAGIDTEEMFEKDGDERVLAGLSRKVRHWDKVKALELVGKHLGMFREKIEVSGKDGDALVVEVRTYKDGGA